jgi:hypothetical protein
VSSNRPTFQDAANQLSALVERSIGHRELLWVFREDVTIKRRGTWVRAADSAGNEILAKRLYDEGQRKGMGLALGVFCLVEPATACCYVFIPTDRVDAEQAMVSDLKLSVPASPRVGKGLANGPLVALQYLLSGPVVEDPFASELPSKRAV